MLSVYSIVQGIPRFPSVQLDHLAQVFYSPSRRHLVYGWNWLAEPEIGHGLRVIDARTGLTNGSSASPIGDFAIAPHGGSAVASGSGFVEMYDLGVEVSRFDVGAPLTAIEMSPAGTPLVAVADTSAAVSVIATAGGTRLARRPVPGTIAGLAFADGGQAVAVGGSNRVRLFSIVGERNWKVDTIGPVNALAAVGAGGAAIATAAGRTARLLNSTNGEGRGPPPTLTRRPSPASPPVATADGSPPAAPTAEPESSTR